MSQLPHLFPQNTASTHPYTYPRIVGSSEFKLPPRDKVIHASNLTSQIKSAKQQFDSEIKAKDVYEEPKGIILDFESSQEFELQLKSLDNKTNGIELRASSVDSNNVMHGVVFVPQEKITHFIKRINEYASVYTKKGEPKHKNLVASINQIKLGTLKSFWTDNAPFPEKLNISTWWEIWLSEPTNAHESVKQLRKMAEKHNLLVSNHHLSFPDRSVVLMKSTFDELAELENLFDIIAELRIAKILAGEFMNLMPRDQAEMIDELIQRITPPALDAPTVCHLDTGVNRGHPLLKLGLEEKHLLAVDPTWDGADGDINQHGTGMAGLALYGCLTEVLNSTDKIHLKHRLESVKFLPNRGQNDPDLYGEISSQAVSRIEIIEPERVQRAYCLTITTNDHRDEGYPSSWSAALDKITSGADENKAPSRLIFVSAGNTPNEGRNEYPNSNQLQPVEDPAQSWNVITVGGFTNRSIIKDQTYRDWKPIASDGGLSPCSRTSILWQDKEWPIKPDIVMEAGNQAIDPSTKQADYVDDLSLLTVCTKRNGAQLTTTGDTSGATALAARYAAMIWSKYPDLSPESVRGLLIHSARWTDSMKKEFPDNKKISVQNRLRVYGYGVPDINLALWSAGNNATLIIQNVLQPFYKREKESTAKTKDMHLHNLPWPKEVLESLGETEIKLRITLSYFIQPSPGRRGTKTKHRYQSHGLRFDLKRPTDTDEVFIKRITKNAWEEDEKMPSRGSDEREWLIGTRARTKGSLHSDVWTGTAVELARAGVVAVYPVTGWWKERPYQNKWDGLAKYSLIMSLETPIAEIDLYTPIQNQITQTIETEISTD